MSTNMKVRKKGRETTALEKRNTAVAVFAGVAIIPLLFMLWIGYQLGDANKVNKDNLKAQLDTKIAELEKAHADMAVFQQTVSELGYTFAKADSVYDKFRTEGLKKLNDQLKDAETESDFRRWDNDMDEGQDDFKHTIERIEKPLVFEEDSPIYDILENAKAWLVAYSKAKADEMYEIKLNRKNTQGIETASDLEKKIQELEFEIQKKDLTITNLKTQSNIKAGNELNKDKSNEKELTESQTAYLNVITSNREIKTAIETEISAITEDIVPELRREIFNKKQFNKLKDKLEAKLNTITTKTAELIIR